MREAYQNAGIALRDARDSTRPDGDSRRDDNARMTTSRVEAPARWQQCAPVRHSARRTGPAHVVSGLRRTAGRDVPHARRTRRRTASHVLRPGCDMAPVSGGPHEVSGVWRYAELIMSAPPAAWCRSPKATRRCSPTNACHHGRDASGSCSSTKGMNPTGSFKDRGMCGGRDAGQACPGSRRCLCVHGQHVGVTRRVRGAGRAAGARARTCGPGCDGEAAADARLRCAHAGCSWRL